MMPSPSASGAASSMPHYVALFKGSLTKDGRVQIPLHCAVGTSPSHPPVHPAGHLAGHPSAEHQLTMMPSPSASGAASSMPHYVASFEGSLTKDGRKLLASAIESHRYLVNCIDNADTSSDASTSIRPLPHSLSSPALHNMLMDKTQFDVIHMGHRYNTLNGMSSAYDMLAVLPPIPSATDIQLMTPEALRDMNNEADTNEDTSSPSGIELTGQQDSEATVTFLNKHDSFVRKLQTHPIYSHKRYVSRSYHQMVYDNVHNVIKKPALRYAEYDANPHRSPYKASEPAEVAHKKVFWQSLVHRLDKGAQTVMKKISPFKLCDKLQRKEKLKRTKVEHHASVYYGPKEGTLLKLNHWVSTPALWTIPRCKSFKREGADDTIETIQTMADITPRTSVSVRSFPTT
ncbi:hypothetical protein M422DRAFT_260718 [Sphaerobolus stellatus SS14]|uniref:Uncharacterized protein n=1 Tax=Sphaerobolus stellatus (strain SS14) TaxID=990650 RepID=A0A0C9UQ73_SPHS4|nr:hypothetical protein M422DRAFT_260718 [Sphaerobolus stellatus SS14]